MTDFMGCALVGLIILVTVGACWLLSKIFDKWLNGTGKTDLDKDDY